VHGVRMLERTLSWLGWIGVVLWVSGLLPVLLEEADGVSWQFGEDDLTLRELIEGVLNVGLALLLALWLSSVVENRLLRGAVGSNLSLRKVLAQGLRAVLVFMAVLIALTAVGIDLTALSVFGGAIGVGIGLGLQRLAANYVSGFVVLTERAVRIGDMVRVDGFEGQVTDIRARYTVVRALSGRESIVPNEMMVTQRIENMSLADRRISQSTVVSVAYDADPEQVQQLLRQAALSCERVLRQPAPSALLTGFGADGLEFTVGYWMDEPTAGQLGLRSEVNLAILAALREHGIDIPYPQRVVHQLPVPSAVPPPSPHAEPAPPLSVA
jgi:small-conductance mechanosensitive channel